jgi:hypothetical protein
VRGVRDELLEQLARAEESAVQLGRNCRIGPNGFIEEVRILCKPWGITPGPVRASLWTGEFDQMHPPSHARRVAEILSGDPPVTVVPGVEQIGLLVIFEEALRFATFSGP